MRMWQYPKVQSWAVLLIISIFVLSFSLDAYAARRRRGWGGNYQYRQNPRTTQYVPQQRYVVRQPVYLVPVAPAEAAPNNQGYTTQAEVNRNSESVIEHGSHRSQGNHSYDVNGRYRASYNGQPVGSGGYDYRGRSSQTYQHDGSNWVKAEINSLQRAIANANEETANELQELVTLATQFENLLLVANHRLANYGAPELDRDVAKRLQNSGRQLIRARAQAIQAQDSWDKDRYNREADQVWQNMVTVIRAYGICLVLAGRVPEAQQVVAALEEIDF